MCPTDKEISDIVAHMMSNEPAGIRFQLRIVKMSEEMRVKLLARLALIEAVENVSKALEG